MRSSDHIINKVDNPQRETKMKYVMILPAFIDTEIYIYIYIRQQPPSYELVTLPFPINHHRRC